MANSGTTKKRQRVGGADLVLLAIPTFFIYSAFFLVFSLVGPEERYKPTYSMMPTLVLQTILELAWPYLDLVIVRAVRRLPSAERSCIRKSETVESMLMVLLVRLPSVMVGTAFVFPDFLAPFASTTWVTIFRFFVGFALPAGIFRVHRYFLAAMAARYAEAKKQRDQDV